MKREPKKNVVSLRSVTGNPSAHQRFVQHVRAVLGGVELTTAFIRGHYAISRATAKRDLALVRDFFAIPVLAKALDLADSCARADIESTCVPADHVAGTPFEWWDTKRGDECDRELVSEALGYLYARGLIREHVAIPGVVAFREAPPLTPHPSPLIATPEAEP